MKRFILGILVFISVGAIAQNRQFDHLEHLYDQGHYKRVHRKAKALLNNPEYDFSVVPSYYVAITGFQLLINDKWKNKSQKEFEFAEEQFNLFTAGDSKNKLRAAHEEELYYLKKDLTAWIEQNKGNNQKNIEKNVVKLLSNYFNMDTPTPSNIIQEDAVSENTETVTSANSTDNSVVNYAKKFLGTKYKWAGTTPAGFDCSGYTSYVMKNFNKTIPRRASDQYLKSKKVKLKNVKPGDLVFFGTKNNISHVGIIVSSEKNNPVMIHSSSSRGIIITDIYKSSYWKNKLYGFGSF